MNIGASSLYMSLELGFETPKACRGRFCTVDPEVVFPHNVLASKLLEAWNVSTLENGRRGSKLRPHIGHMGGVLRLACLPGEESPGRIVGEMDLARPERS